MPCIKPRVVATLRRSRPTNQMRLRVPIMFHGCVNWGASRKLVIATEHKREVTLIKCANPSPEQLTLSVTMEGDSAIVNMPAKAVKMFGWMDGDMIGITDLGDSVLLTWMGHEQECPKSLPRGRHKKSRRRSTR